MRIRPKKLFQATGDTTGRAMQVLGKHSTLRGTWAEPRRGRRGQVQKDDAEKTSKVARLGWNVNALPGDLGCIWEPFCDS